MVFTLGLTCGDDMESCLSWLFKDSVHTSPGSPAWLLCCGWCSLPRPKGQFGPTCSGSPADKLRTGRGLTGRTKQNTTPPCSAPPQCHPIILVASPCAPTPCGSSDQQDCHAASNKKSQLISEAAGRAPTQLAAAGTHVCCLLSCLKRHNLSPAALLLSAATLLLCQATPRLQTTKHPSQFTT